MNYNSNVPPKPIPPQNMEINENMQAKEKIKISPK